MYYTSSLAHYGVPGMKWGVRKQRELVGRRRGVGGSFNNSNRRSRSYSVKKNGNASTNSVKRKVRAKKAVIAGAAVVGTVLAAYGASKLIKGHSMKIQTKKGLDMFNKMVGTDRSSIKSVAKFDNGISRISASKGRSSMVYDVGTDKLKIAEKEYNTYIKKGSNMNTLDAAKNIMNYYRKKK